MLETRWLSEFNCILLCDLVFGGPTELFTQLFFIQLERISFDRRRFSVSLRAKTSLQAKFGKPGEFTGPFGDGITQQG